MIVIVKVIVVNMVTAATPINALASHANYCNQGFYTLSLTFTRNNPEM